MGKSSKNSGNSSEAVGKKLKKVYEKKVKLLKIRKIHSILSAESWKGFFFQKNGVNYCSFGHSLEGCNSFSRVNDDCVRRIHELEFSTACSWVTFPI